MTADGWTADGAQIGYLGATAHWMQKLHSGNYSLKQLVSARSLVCTQERIWGDISLGSVTVLVLCRTHIQK